MADPSSVAERARRNGDQASADGIPRALREPLEGLSGLARAGGELAVATQGFTARLAGRAMRRLQDRLRADLDDRDPDYIRENLPLSWLLSTIWYRAEVRNLGNIREEGPVLLVGNHSGGNVAPEVIILPLAFSTFFGVERPFYQLAHNLVLAMPVGQILRRWGTIAASPENAQRALDCGGAVLVFPGGDWEVHRPTWERYKIDFANRKGFIRLALKQRVPIVPVVTVGGQETALFLTRGAWIAKALRLDSLFRLKVLPISIALPWGINVGDMLGHLPLPAKITTEVLPAIDMEEQFGTDPDPDEVYDHLVRVMQETLDALAAERRFPIIG